MIIIPRKVRINGAMWRVERVDLAPDLLGETLPSIRTIRLSRDLKGQHLEVIWLHELLHACLGTEVDLYIKDDMDELLVTLLAPRLLDVLKRLGKW